MMKVHVDNGDAGAGLLLFGQMKELGLSPDEGTFRLVLLACDGVGSVQECLRQFKSMKKEYKLVSGMEHYLGVINVLGKAGHLNEAMEFIEDIPFEPANDVWECLMNCARIHGDVELEDRCLVFLDPTMELPDNLMLTSGSNMLEGKNKAHKYRTPDPYKEDAYDKLNGLNGQIRDAGYVPDTRYWPNLGCILRYGGGGGGRVWRGKWGLLMAESGEVTVGRRSKLGVSARRPRGCSYGGFLVPLPYLQALASLQEGIAILAGLAFDDVVLLLTKIAAYKETKLQAAGAHISKMAVTKKTLRSPLTSSVQFWPFTCEPSSFVKFKNERNNRRHEGQSRFRINCVSTTSYPYKTLSINLSALESEVKKAFRQLASKRK
nr:pentatricopeptide repeat-containing protein At2g15690-like [Tanacetum cinerariifolium]